MNEAISPQDILPEMQTLLDLCAQTRYSALLPPSNQNGAVMHLRLLASEVDDLKSRREPQLRASIQEIIEAHPCLVLDAAASRMDLRWLIPLWQPAARPWLQAVRHQGQLLVMLEAIDQPSMVTLLRMKAPAEDLDKLLALDIEASTDFRHCADTMMLSGFRALVGLHTNREQALRMRLSVACDPVTAGSVHTTFQQGAGMVKQSFREVSSPTVD
jgi:hypothetical protein